MGSAAGGGSAVARYGDTLSRAPIWVRATSLSTRNLLSLSTLPPISACYHAVQTISSLVVLGARGQITVRSGLVA